MQITNTLEFKERNILSLSGGERQRAQLARALTQLDDTNGYSGYLLLDEFDANMDIYQQHLTYTLLKNLCQKYQLGIIIIGHNLNIAAAFFDFCILVKHGRLLVAGKTSDILTKDNIRLAFNFSKNSNFNTQFSWDN